MRATQELRRLKGDGRMESLRKNVVVTGASSGIGRATALRLARSGWRVYATVRSDTDAESLVAESGGAVRTLRLDVTDSESIAAAARAVHAEVAGNGLDGLVNNAGIGVTMPVEYTTPELLREVFEINLFGQIEVIRAFLPMLRRARGCVVNLGSVGDHITPPFGGALASSKAAFAAMSTALRLEVRSQGIRVVVIEPGAIHTPAVKKTLGHVDETIRGFPSEGAAHYGEAMRQMTLVFTQRERAGSPPEAVAAVIERALTARRPCTRYPAGKDARKITMLARILPEMMLDRLILRMFGLAKLGTAPAPRRPVPMQRHRHA